MSDPHLGEAVNPATDSILSFLQTEIILKSKNYTMTDRNSGCLAQANPGNLTPTYLNMAKECMKRKTEKLFTDKEWNSSFPSLPHYLLLVSSAFLSTVKLAF